MREGHARFCTTSTYLEASLFFSFLDRGRAVKGSSLTGVRSLMTLFSFRSSLPICSSFLGLGVRSSTSVLRDFFTAYFPGDGVKQVFTYTVLLNKRHAFCSPFKATSPTPPFPCSQVLACFRSLRMLTPSARTTSLLSFPRRDCKKWG